MGHLHVVRVDSGRKVIVDELTSGRVRYRITRERKARWCYRNQNEQQRSVTSKKVGGGASPLLIPPFSGT